MLIIIVICLICQATVTSPTWTFDWVVLQILVTIEGRGQRNVNHSRGSGHGRGPYIDHGLSSGNSSNPSSCFRGLFLAGPRPDLHYKHEMFVAPWKQLNLVIRKSQVISSRVLIPKSSRNPYFQGPLSQKENWSLIRSFT